MRTLALAMITLFLLALAPATASGGSENVTLEMTLLGGDHKSCAVSFTAGGNLGDVLDAAVASGCLSSWTYVDYGAWGRFVDCIDGICGQSAAIFAGTYWNVYHNDESASVGIDDIMPTSGDVVGFDYTHYTFLPL